MAKCPRDGTPIDVDYGMTSCPSCGAIVFVDMDGNAQLGGDSDAAAEVSYEVGESTKVGISAPVFPDPPSDAIEISIDSGPSSNQENESYDDPLASLNRESSQEAESPGYGVPEAPPLPMPSSEEVSDRQNLAMDQFLGYAEAPPPEEATQDGDPGKPGDPLGIVDYANSEYSQAKDGPFLFRLIIGGIDSKEIRESLREALTDSRFGWDVDRIMRDISRGELKIQNVSPVKATIVINRIKRLPVQIRWEQYAVTQTEPS